MGVRCGLLSSWCCIQIAVGGEKERGQERKQELEKHLTKDVNFAMLIGTSAIPLEFL